MKKFIIAISAVLYLGTSSGATIHLHYCMDKLVSWSFRSSHSDYCSKCGMNKSAKHQAKGCCKDDQRQVKLAVDQKTTDNFQLISPAFAATFIPFFELPVIYYSTSIIDQNSRSHAPPGGFNLDLYVSNCVFRI